MQGGWDTRQVAQAWVKSHTGVTGKITQMNEFPPPVAAVGRGWLRATPSLHGYAVPVWHTLQDCGGNL